MDKLIKTAVTLYIGARISKVATNLRRNVNLHKRNHYG